MAAGGAIEKYGDIRSALSDADVLLFRGEGLVSRVAAIGGGGIYSHAGITFWDGDRVKLVQATGSKGVHVCFLSDELREYHGAVEHWRVHPPHDGPPFDPKGAVAEANKRVGAVYAYPLLLKFFWDWLFRPVFRRNFRSRARSVRAFFCSQLVAHSYRVGGKLDLDPHHGDAATGPGDLARGGRIAHLRQFARDDVVDRLPPSP